MASSKNRVKKGYNKPSLKTWVCDKGCKLSTTPCPHLEEILPKADYLGEFERKSRYAGSRVDKAAPQVADRAEEKARFISRVGKGLDPIEVDILVLRYVYDEEFETIARELRLLSTDTVIRIHNETLKKLKGKLEN